MTINEVRAQIALGTMDRMLIRQTAYTTSDPEIIQILFDNIVGADLEPFSRNPHTPRSVQNNIVKSRYHNIVSYHLKECIHDR